jgi:hypothetical protein
VNNPNVYSRSGYQPVHTESSVGKDGWQLRLIITRTDDNRDVGRRHRVGWQLEGKHTEKFVKNGGARIREKGSTWSRNIKDAKETLCSVAKMYWPSSVVTGVPAVTPCIDIRSLSSLHPTTYLESPSAKEYTRYREAAE